MIPAFFVMFMAAVLSGQIAKKYPEITEKSDRAVCAESKYICESESVGE